MAFVIAGFLSNLALNIENNDSRITGIPKKEFIRVIGGIISGSYNRDSDLRQEVEEDQDYLINNRSNVINDTPRTMATKIAQNTQNINIRQRNKGKKRDSLYFLQKSMEARENEIKKLESNYIW